MAARTILRYDFCGYDIAAIRQFVDHAASSLGIVVKPGEKLLLKPNLLQPPRGTRDPVVTSSEVILAVADYYERQGDSPAEAMHLNRALNDLRTAIEAEPGSEALWTTLARVLNRRHGPGPASCACSAAVALGHPASLFEGDVTARNEALGEPKLPLSPVVDALVAPSNLPQTARRLFALCEHSFDKVLPFDASA